MFSYFLQNKNQKSNQKNNDDDDDCTSIGWKFSIYWFDKSKIDWSNQIKSTQLKQNDHQQLGFGKKRGNRKFPFFSRHNYHHHYGKLHLLMRCEKKKEKNVDRFLIENNNNNFPFFSAEIFPKSFLNSSKKNLPESWWFVAGGGEIVVVTFVFCNFSVNISCKIGNDNVDDLEIVVVDVNGVVINNDDDDWSLFNRFIDDSVISDDCCCCCCCNCCCNCRCIRCKRWSG